jgi:hypothetical protein
MQDRTKFFADQEARAEEERKEREAHDARERAQREALSERFAKVGRIYETQLTRVADRLRASSVAAYVLAGAEVIRVVDPNSGDSFTGTPALVLTISTAVDEYRFAVLHVTEPSALSMVCWRKGKGKAAFHKMLGSALQPSTLIEDPSQAEKFVNDALDAARLG